MDVHEAIELQEEEIETLRAIYAEELSVGGTPGARELTISIAPASTAGSSAPALQLWVALPSGYPLDAEQQPPFGLTGSLAAALEDSHIEASLSELWADADGAGVIWPWVEWLREFIEPFLLEQPEPEPEPEPGSNLEPADEVVPQQFESDWAAALDAADAAEQSTPETAMRIAHGEPFIDRKSVFQAHCAKVTSVSLSLCLSVSASVSASVSVSVCLSICFYVSDSDSDSDSAALVPR